MDLVQRPTLPISVVHTTDTDPERSHAGRISAPRRNRLADNEIEQTLRVPSFTESRTLHLAPATVNIHAACVREQYHRG